MDKYQANALRIALVTLAELMPRGCSAMVERDQQGLCTLTVDGNDGEIHVTHWMRNGHVAVEAHPH